MKNLIKYFAVLLIISIGTVTAQKRDYTNEPGYVDFGDLSEFEEGEMVAEVFIESYLLKMVGKLTQNEEPELAELIGGLKLIKVNVFGVNEDNIGQINGRVELINKNLANNGWDRIVRVRDGGETANVHIKTNNGEDIVGLVVLAVDENGEAAFVNIVGNINLEIIGKLGEKFDIPSLGDINGNND